MYKLVFLLIIGLKTTIAYGQINQKITKIDNLLKKMYHLKQYNGTALIAQNGKTLYKRAFGVANIETSVPLFTNSPFNIASCSKQYTAMMIMMLKEEGKLNYDDLVVKHLPEFPYPNISIRHLMTHTSGLPEYYDIIDKYYSAKDTIYNNMVLNAICKVVPVVDFKAGEDWKYGDTGFALLPNIIEKLSGESIHEFFEKRIVKKLNLKNTYLFNIKDKKAPKNKAFGYKYEEKKPIMDDVTRYDGIVGDGNVFTSVEDMLIWEQSFYTEKLVKKATIQEALTPVKLNNGTIKDYGFGWGISNTYKTGLKNAHMGYWVGFRSIIVRYPQKKQTLIVFCNNGNDEPMKLAEKIMDGEQKITYKQKHN